jgi:hypothetical protein
MQTNETVGSTLSKKRPIWLRVLIGLGVAFLLFNTLGVVLFFTASSMNTGMLGSLVRLALVGAVLAIPLWKWHGLNVLHTWRNPATASFTRRDDPATGGHLFDVLPARAARMPALPLFAIGILVLLMALMVGTRSTWGFVGLFIFALVFISVGCSFVLPGARDRKPAKISVSTHGVQSGDIGIPLKAVSDLYVAHGGLVVDPDPLMPGPNGVPIASMAGRHMGRRQSARGYAVMIRADGESEASILAGGLTEDCARALVADIKKLTAAISPSMSA